MSKRLRAAIERDDAREIRYGVEEALRNEGYASDTPLTEKTLARALERFQRDNGLRESGRIDEGTLAIIQMPLCGTARLAVSGAFDESMAFTNAWPTRSLTFSFLNSSPLGSAVDRATTLAAFLRWSSVTTLTFSEATPGNIRIGWFFGDHGDGLPVLSFDGRGNVFGHGFAPASSVKPGEVHMDAAETWSTGAFVPGNADLLTVVLHEIGHALGLTDVSDIDAVMFRRFPIDRVKHVLNGTDIAGIRALYP
jgi:hypothetical protein